jgi:hypothetical protein
VDELHTSDEGASNVNPRVRNLVTTRVMYYTFSTTGIIPTKFLNKYFSLFQQMVSLYGNYLHLGLAMDHSLFSVAP